MADERYRDASHFCEDCGWSGWAPPEINARGEHLHPDGGVCTGLISCMTSPTAISSGEEGSTDAR